MESSIGLATVELFVVFLAVATLVALVITKIALPYSLALVLTGLVLAFVIPGQRVEVTPELILAVLIPGLVFEAAYKIDLGELRRGFGIVAVLAAPGVLITAAAVAIVVPMFTGLTMGEAFVLGAIVSATDPVAVVALFKKVGAPRRLATLVDAESLLNDGTGVVLFTIALTALTTPVTVADGVLSFVVIVVFSTIIGLIGGFVADRLMRITRDPQLVVAISLVAAYGTYLIADHLHESGIIATVVVGLVIGARLAEGKVDEESRKALDTVWEFIAFLLTAFVFSLVGLAITPSLLLLAVPVIVIGYVAITVARALVVYGLVGLGTRLVTRQPLPRGYTHVMFWSGLRGAIAVALALALPPGMEHRDLLTGAVFGIVLVTLVVQGTTAGIVVRRSGVLDQPDEAAPAAA